MRIVDAQPAPKYVNLSTEILTTALAQLGKGQLDTLLRIALFLWGNQALDGSTAEFTERLAVAPRTWQRHVPELGQSGCLLYSQPQHGFYGLVGFAEDPELLRECWAEALTAIEHTPRQQRPKRHEIPGAVLAQYQHRRALGETSKVTDTDATKLSFPVVDVLSQSDHNVVKSDQPRNILRRGSGGNGDATKVTQSAATKMADGDAVLASVVALYEREIGGTLTAMVYDELADLTAQCRDVERWQYAFKQSVGARNRWKYARAIILHPERQAAGKGKEHGRGKDRGRGAGGNGAGDEESRRKAADAAARERLRERGISV